jgi:hypothetical protein
MFIEMASGAMSAGDGGHGCVPDSVTSRDGARMRETQGREAPGSEAG